MDPVPVWLFAVVCGYGVVWGLILWLGGHCWCGVVAVGAKNCLRTELVLVGFRDVEIGKLSRGFGDSLQDDLECVV